jgi:hypothetical protein
MPKTLKNIKYKRKSLKGGSSFFKPRRTPATQQVGVSSSGPKGSVNNEAATKLAATQGGKVEGEKSKLQIRTAEQKRPSPRATVRPGRGSTPAPANAPSSAQAQEPAAPSSAIAPAQARTNAPSSAQEPAAAQARTNAPANAGVETQENVKVINPTQLKSITSTLEQTTNNYTNLIENIKKFIRELNNNEPAGPPPELPGAPRTKEVLTENASEIIRLAQAARGDTPPSTLAQQPGVGGTGGTDI